MIDTLKHQEFVQVGAEEEEEEEEEDGGGGGQQEEQAWWTYLLSLNSSPSEAKWPRKTWRAIVPLQVWRRIAG